MKIRSFRLGDYADVTRLLREVLSVECNKDTIEACAKQLSLDSELVLVGEKNQQIVGVIIGTIDNDEGYYYRIAVDTPYQRKGYGKILAQSLKQMFMQRNVISIKITADSYHEPAFPLYESLGFGKQDFCNTYQKLRIVN